MPVNTGVLHRAGAPSPSRDLDPESARPSGPVGLDAVRARLTGRVPTRLRPHLPDLLAYGTYLLLAIWACGRLWSHPRGRISGHLPIDNVEFFWWLSHAARSLVHFDNPFFSTQMNAPDGVNIMANTSVLGIGIPLAPVTLLFGPQVSYDVYLTLALAGSAATCYYVLSRHLVRSRLAAFLGGAFFGFAPGVVHHANGQPNFVSNFLLPLIVLRVVKLREPGRWLRNGMILALLVCWQLFLNEELLTLTALGCLAVIACYAAMRPADARRAVRPFVLGGAVAVGVATPLLAYPIWFQFTGPQSYAGIPELFNNWGEDITAFFTFARDTLAGSSPVEQTIGRTEQNSWFGAPLVILTVIMVVLMWRCSLPARVVTVVGTGFAVLALGPHLRLDGRERPSVPLPWLVFEHAPLVRYMYPSRLIFVVIACLAVLLALACDRVPRLELPGSPVRFRYLWALAVAVALIPIIPRPMPGVSPPHVPAFISAGGWKDYVDDRHSLVTVPLPSNTLGLKAVMWSAVTGQEFKIPRGYFLGPDRDQGGVGRFGATRSKTDDLLVKVSNTGRFADVTAADRENALAELRYWRAAIVVLDPTDRRAEQLRKAVTDLTGITPRYVTDVWVWDVRTLVDGAGR